MAAQLQTGGSLVQMVTWTLDSGSGIDDLAVEEAKSQGADLICFSELASCGYPPRDFLEFKDFIRRSMAVVNELCKMSKDIAIVVGAPTVNPEI